MYPSSNIVNHLLLNLPLACLPLWVPQDLVSCHSEIWEHIGARGATFVDWSQSSLIVLSLFVHGPQSHDQAWCALTVFPSPVYSITQTHMPFQQLTLTGVLSHPSFIIQLHSSTSIDHFIAGQQTGHGHCPGHPLQHSEVHSSWQLSELEPGSEHSAMAGVPIGWFGFNTWKQILSLTIPCRINILWSITFLMMDDLTQQFNIPQVKLITSTLNNFIIQPSSLTLYAQNIMFASMLPMKVTILFTHKGGVKVGDVNAKALILSIPIHSTFPCVASLPPSSSTSRLQKLKATLVDFLTHLYSVYIDLHCLHPQAHPDSRS